MPNDNLKLKNTAVAVFLGFLAAVIIYSLLWGPAKKFMDSFLPAKTFSVSAEGKTVVSPDIANISFSVVSEGKNPEIIAEENNRKISLAIDLVKSHGVEEKDIKTTQYNLNPKYEYDEKIKKSFISGYTLTQTVLAKVRNLGKVSKILGGLPGLGINQIDSISFDIDDPEKYLIEARNQAFDKAKEKAKSMAEKNGVRLGKIINFGEYQSGPVYYGYESFSKAGGLDAGASIAVPTIQPGSQEVKINISITYEIK